MQALSPAQRRLHVRTAGMNFVNPSAANRGKRASAVLTPAILGSIHIGPPGNGVFHVIQAFGVFDDLREATVGSTW